MLTTITVDRFRAIVNEQINTCGTYFNDPRITDFSQVNFMALWKIANILKKTKVNTVQISIDYDNDLLIISGVDYSFRYSLFLKGV